jgi:hypothetical protein
MKPLLLATLLFTGNLIFPAQAADVGVSISVDEPGFFGRIDIGGFPQPRVIYEQPILVEAVALSQQVIYLRVPHKHAKNWHKHCHKYQACGERVLFVQDSWYVNEYEPHHHKHSGKKDKGHKDKGHKDKGHKDKHHD